MLGLSLEQIKNKIEESGKLTGPEIDKRITEKLTSLSGLISEEGAAHIIANELGVKLIPKSGELKIKDVMNGMRNVEVSGKVLRKYDIRDFVTERGPGRVASFLLGDETGSLRVTLWNDLTAHFEKFVEQDTLQIKDAYVKDNNGKPEIQLNSLSKIHINPSGVNIAVKNQESMIRKTLKELGDNEENIEVLGTIVQVFDIRFFEVCAECNKRLQQTDGSWRCSTHGQVKPDYNYVLNVFLDDGTDSMRTTFWKNQIQRLLDLSDSDILQFRENPAGFEEVKTDLLGNIVKVVGRTRLNQAMNSLEFVSNMVYRNPDPKEELKRLETQGTNKVATEQKKVEPVLTNAQNTPNKTVEQSVHQSTHSTMQSGSLREAPGFVTAAEDAKKQSVDMQGIDEDLISIDDLEDFE